jgi:hypothetical protein
MRKPVLVLSTIIAVGSAPLARVGAAQEAAAKPRPAEAQKAASPAPDSAQTKEKEKEIDPRLAARGVTPETGKRPPRTMKMFLAEFRGLDLDKKTVSFQTDDGKSYTVEAQVPGLPEAVERAAQLAQVLQPGDRIRMLCRVNEKEEPTLILTLHMVGPKAPMRYR